VKISINYNTSVVVAAKLTGSKPSNISTVCPSPRQGGLWQWQQSAAPCNKLASITCGGGGEGGGISLLTW